MLSILIGSLLAAPFGAGTPVELPARKHLSSDGTLTLQCLAVPVDGEDPPAEVFLCAARWGVIFRAALKSGLIAESDMDIAPEGWIMRGLALAGNEGFGPSGPGRAVHLYLLPTLDGQLSGIALDGGSGIQVEKRTPHFIWFECEALDCAAAE